MPAPTPRRLRRTAVLAGTLLVVAQIAAAQSPALPRVRSTHAYIRAMIDEAATRSATFRRLVTAIAGTNGIVYVEQGDCGHSVRACLTLSVTRPETTGSCGSWSRRASPIGR